ncbi:MAG: Plasmid stabilization system [Candidatus Nomurabacteria bacterium GW2011_GWB1_40_7]|uniref:Plasmid stabilization system n=1 Tax=Candidatus Nomurabacteria bacterium GW2011_GWB1_40_7 TaxID=1618744 RepID=A0A0G0T675_9BACT|nr:MAG: Plasmid stabilization system [Candidatus Nomurabacteria bacterium GW2011_GWB1_40_7]
MIKLIYAPVFVKQLKKLELALQDDVLEKIELFKDKKNHKILKVHKLHGKFTDCFSFSVNYNTRIVFEHLTSDEVALLFVGGHDIYN